MIFFDEWEMSQWAYLACLHGNDIPEMRKLIKYDNYICLYCQYVKDRPEMWSKIRDDYWARYYCQFVKNRSKVRKYIVNNVAWEKDFNYIKNI